MTATPPPLHPRTTALLVMDYQPGILASLPGQPEPQELLSRVAGAVADMRKYGGTIAHVRVGFTEADWAAIPPANTTFSFIGRQRLMHHADPATDFHGQLAPEPGDITVRKTRFGALSTTDLDRQLRERGITTLVLAGISTSGVVLSTVTDAADRDYRLYILSDGVADSDPHVHQTLMTGVFPRLAHIIDTAELRSLLQQDQPGPTADDGALPPMISDPQGPPSAVERWQEYVDVHDFLDQVRLRPNMWLTGGSLRQLESILIGYRVALGVHAIDEPFPFWPGEGFARWLLERHGMSGAIGWAAEIERRTPDGSTPVDEFFRLLDEYRSDMAEHA